MALPKAVYDREAPTANLVTTISGIITLVLAVLVALGVLTPEQSTEVGQHAMAILQAVVAIWSAIAGLVLIFKAKDS